MPQPPRTASCQYKAADPLNWCQTTGSRQTCSDHAAHLVFTFQARSVRELPTSPRFECRRGAEQAEDGTYRCGREP